MLTRQANPKDSQAILKMLKTLDLYYSSLELKNFWVAEIDKKNVGCVQVEEYDTFSFLGSLAVDPSVQERGIGTQLMQQAIKTAQKDIYLYTIIPDFFKKFGFEVCALRPDLPGKDRYECEWCQREKCACMVRKVKS